MKRLLAGRYPDYALALSTVFNPSLRSMPHLMNEMTACLLSTPQQPMRY